MNKKAKQLILKDKISTDLAFAMELVKRQSKTGGMYHGFSRYDYLFVLDIYRKHFMGGTLTEKQSAAFCKCVSKYWASVENVMPEVLDEVLTVGHRKLALEAV
jgi:hypothetical protein